MNRTAVLNVVGLTRSLIGQHTPKLSRFFDGARSTTISPAFPAVTCTAQSTYVTGNPPASHGIVGNGWYDRSLAEVQFWKQSNHLVQGPKLWDDLRAQDQSFTCAKLFWWYNMYASVDYSITPRPMYPADGRKVFDVYTWPYNIRTEIKRDLGEFPFHAFWGPASGIASSEWIAASAKWIEERHRPTLSLVYLPHLDYPFQKLGPRDRAIPSELGKIDRVAGDLIDFFEARGVQVIVLSEYGITEADQPVHLNRVLREHGWITVKDELGLELLDAGASRAFAVADHQVAHVYVNDPSILSGARRVLEQQPGVERVLDRDEQARIGVAHPRSGDLIAVASRQAWFTYYYWMDDRVAPDFARAVDIHRKPGYDPVELFLDPALKFPKAKIGWSLLKKKLGMRMVMRVIPLDATLVKGSHGRIPEDAADHPVIASKTGDCIPGTPVEAIDVYGILRTHVTGEARPRHANG